MARIEIGAFFKCIFLNENVRISIKISLKFVAKDPINNIPALVQIIALGWLAPSHRLKQWRLVYWCIYTSLGLIEYIIIWWSRAMFSMNAVVLS